MQIVKLDSSQLKEFKLLISIFKEVFENKSPIPNDDHLKQLLKKPDFIVFVAKMEEVMVGGLTIYILHRYFGTKPEAYIYDLGISPKYQRRGIGKALLSAVCAYCKSNGVADIYVEAEADDENAVEFYRHTAYDEEVQAIHFTYLLS